MDIQKDGRDVIQRYIAQHHILLCYNYINDSYSEPEVVALFQSSLVCAGVAVTLNKFLKETNQLGPEL